MKEVLMKQLKETIESLKQSSFSDEQYQRMIEALGNINSLIRIAEEKRKKQIIRTRRMITVAIAALAFTGGYLLGQKDVERSYYDGVSYGMGISGVSK